MIIDVGWYSTPYSRNVSSIIAICSNVHLCKPFLAKNLCVEPMGTLYTIMKTSLRSQFRPSLSFPPGAPLRRGGVFLRRLLRRAGGAGKTCGPGRRKLLHPTFCGCAAT